LITTAAGPAGAAKLSAGRIGRHSSYSRIVFEFEEPAQYRIQEQKDIGRLAVVFFDSFGDVPQSLATENSRCIQAAVIAKQDEDLVADISLFSPRYRLKPFTLQNPFRMVLDIFCSEETDSTPLPPESNKAAPVNASSVQPPLPAPSESPSRPTRPLNQQNNIPLRMENFGPAPVKNSAFQKDIIAILAALSLIIIILAGVIVLQHRSHPKNTGINAGRIRLKTSRDMLASIDAQIRDKLQANKNR
jgi:stringent starvation protein B